MDVRAEWPPFSALPCMIGPFFRRKYIISLNIYFMYNINIFEHIQDMCLLHYNIIQWDSEESQLTYEVRLPFFCKYECTNTTCDLK